MLVPGESGAAATAQLDWTTRRPPHSQQEVEISRRVHSIEDISIVRDHQLFVIRNDLHQLISLLWLFLQVVFCHGSSNHSWSLILIGQQYAFVKVAIAILQAHSDDACVLGLYVVG